MGRTQLFGSVVSIFEPGGSQNPAKGGRPVGPHGRARREGVDIGRERELRPVGVEVGAREGDGIDAGVAVGGWAGVEGDVVAAGAAVAGAVVPSVVAIRVRGNDEVAASQGADEDTGDGRERQSEDERAMHGIAKPKEAGRETSADCPTFGGTRRVVRPRRRVSAHVEAAGESADEGAKQRPREDVAREVHAQVDAGERDERRQRDAERGRRRGPGGARPAQATGNASARNAATQKLPAACPLGNDGSWGRRTASARSSAIHGRTRPNAALSAQTRVACTATPSVRSPAKRRVRAHARSGMQRERAPPLPDDGRDQHRQTPRAMRSSVHGEEGLHVEMVQRARVRNHASKHELYVTAFTAQALAPVPRRPLPEAVRDPGFTPSVRDLDPLVDLLADDDLEKLAERAIVRLGAEAARSLTARLGPSKPPLRARIVRVLGRLAEEGGARGALLAALEDPDPKTRRNAVIALGHARGPGVEQALLAAWKSDARPEMHRSIAASLGKVGGAASLALLEKRRGRTTRSSRGSRSGPADGRADGDARGAGAHRGGRAPAAPVGLVLVARPGLEDVLTEELSQGPRWPTCAMPDPAACGRAWWGRWAASSRPDDARVPLSPADRVDTRGRERSRTQSRARSRATRRARCSTRGRAARCATASRGQRAATGAR